MIEAKIVADSIGDKSDIRITTFVLTYPRFIHSEFMTHRMFSRNASSSRAIPVKRALASIRNNMVIPSHIGANKAGMQADKEVSAWRRTAALVLWKALGHVACFTASLMDRLGVHKQVVNRVTEPWAHMTVVVTATEWANFFALRYHPMAQPEICELAKAMYAVYESNRPEVLKYSEWHLPFVKPYEWFDLLAYHGRETADNIAIKLSVARCARVSYLTHEGRQPVREDDLKLYDRLLGVAPIHASPAEHQARCLDHPMRSGNFRGWEQYRKTLKDECVTTFIKPENMV